MQLKLAVAQQGGTPWWDNRHTPKTDIIMPTADNDARRYIEVAGRKSLETDPSCARVSSDTKGCQTSVKPVKTNSMLSVWVWKTIRNISASDRM